MLTYESEKLTGDDPEVQAVMGCKMDEEEVGKLYTTDGEDAWRLIAYCRLPTATLENLETKERIGGAIGSLNLKVFSKLIKEV